MTRRTLAAVKPAAAELAASIELETLARQVGALRLSVGILRDAQRSRSPAAPVGALGARARGADGWRGRATLIRLEEKTTCLIAHQYYDQKERLARLGRAGLER
jgi:hypothetical protein